MAKKQVLDKKSKELRSYLETDKLVVGTDETLKNLKAGKIAKVFVASNCREDVLEDIGSISKISDAEVVTMVQPNDDLGVLCKKPFSISVLGVLK